MIEIKNTDEKVKFSARMEALVSPLSLTKIAILGGQDSNGYRGDGYILNLAASNGENTIEQVFETEYEFASLGNQC